MAAEVSVIIPVLNNWELTQGCLRSLARHREGAELEVIVVDNGSADATAAELPALGSALFGDAFKSLRNERNRNFGPACNQGAAAASGAYLFFLNNDTLLSPGWLPPLLKALREEQGLGAAGPLLLYPDHTVQHLGVVFGTRSVRHLYQGYPRGHPLVGKRRLCQALTGAALLLPRELFAALGGFYEEYRNGFEDVDLCLRLGALGYKLRCLSEAVIFHLESRSQGRSAHERRNSALLTRRCLHLRVTDAHLHALRDGLQPVLNDFLDFSILLSHKDSAALLAEALSLPSAQRQGHIEATLAAQPGWLEGALHMRRLAEQNNDAPLALRYADMAMERHFVKDNAAAVLRLAKILGRQDILSKLEPQWEKLSPARLGAIHAACRRAAAAAQDALLLRLLEAKAGEWADNSAAAPAAAQHGEGLQNG